MGCDWFSASHMAFRLRFVRAKGRFCNLHVGKENDESRNELQAFFTTARSRQSSVRLPVSSYIQHMKLSGIREFSRQFAQTVVSQ